MDGSLNSIGSVKLSAVWYSAYHFIFTFYGNSASIWYHYQDIASYLSKVANFSILTRI